MVDPSDQTIFHYIIIVGGSLSFCGCLYMILTFFLCKNLRKDPIFEKIIYLILIDFQLVMWAVLQLIIPVKANYYPCEFLAFYEIFLRLCSLFWAKVFADSVYGTIIKGRSTSTSTVKLIFGAVIAPLTLAVIPFVFGFYGPSDLNCSFSNQSRGPEDFMVYVGFYFLPFMLVFIYNLIIFWRIAIYIKNMFRDMKTFYKLLLYPLALLPVNVITMSYRIEVELVGNVYPDVELVFLAFLVLQGFINTLIYGMDAAVRAEVGNYLRSMCSESTEDWEEKQMQLSSESITLA